MKNTATRERQNRKLYMYYDVFNNFLKLRLRVKKKDQKMYTKILTVV